MEPQDALTEKKAKRFRFLHFVYQKTDGDEHEHLDMWAIGTELGFSREQTERMVDYLVGEHLLQFVAMGGLIGITHYGVVQVERALSEPAQATEYFPPVVNIIHVGTMTGSTIQQAGARSLLTATLQPQEVAPMRELVKELKSVLPDLISAGGRREELEAHVATLEAQVAISTPNRTIVREALYTVRNVLEGMTGSVAASVLLDHIARVWTLL
jgi:hypothetical protein